MPVHEANIGVVGGAPPYLSSSAAAVTAHCKHGRWQWNTPQGPRREHRRYPTAFPHRCLRGHRERQGWHSSSLIWRVSRIVMV